MSKTPKAFIFDMDGVIVDSERAWKTYGAGFLAELFGKDIAEKVGDTIGMTIDGEYEKAAAYGFHMDRDLYYKLYDEKAAYIYTKANITEGIEKLVHTLLANNYALGLVSSSRLNWINAVIEKLSFKKDIRCIISLNERKDLQPKPQPDGYLEAMRKLRAVPNTTIVLEDSNTGILAAKNAGAYTIGFRENLVPGYIQQGADIYAKNMNDVIKIVTSRS